MLKKRERILKKVKSKYWPASHKYGLELPKSVSHALEIDRRSGTDSGGRHFVSANSLFASNVVQLQIVLAILFYKETVSAILF